MVTVTLQFHDGADACDWFLAARRAGAVPDGAGLRETDALDLRGHGMRTHPGALLVTREPGCGPWVVAPELRPVA